MFENEIFTLSFGNAVRKILLGVAVLPLISACSPKYDLQGKDPYKYYAQNPIENKVETRHSLISVNFDRKTGEMIEKETFAAEIMEIRPRAVDEIVVRLPSAMPNKKQHIEYIKKMLRYHGHTKPVKVVSNEAPELYSAMVDITHAAVIPPDCPDWKRSPVTTYSNMTPANYGCSSAVNLGLMIDDPHDLVRGRDSKSSDTQRSNKALSDYKSGASAGAAASSGIGQ